MLNSARVGFVEARDGIAAKQIEEFRGSTSSYKTARNKKKPTLFKWLARRLLGKSSRGHHARRRARGTHQQHIPKSYNPRDQGVIYLPSAKERQRMNEWLYDVKDLLEALDPHEAGDSDGDSEASSSDSERTLTPGINSVAPTQEQDPQTQERMNNSDNTSRAEWCDEVDSNASTLAEEGQPTRKWLIQSFYGIQSLLMLQGVP